MRTVRVVSSLVTNAIGWVLLAKRPAEALRPLMWELPGGKVEGSEWDSDALKRELREELGVSSEIGAPIAQVEFTLDVHVVLVIYAARLLGEPRALASVEVRYFEPSYAMERLPCLPSYYLAYQQILAQVRQGISWVRRQPISSSGPACLTCGTPEELFPAQGLIAVGFGSATLSRDGVVIWSEPVEDTEPSLTGHGAEELARLDPDHSWEICKHTPLYRATWQRQGDNRWVLVERNRGFA